MKTKAFKFKDGRVAISKGIGIRVNKQKPILEEEIGDMSEREIEKLMEKPHNFKFSKKSVKIKK